MGVCLTWFAVRGKTPEAVRADLNLQESGESVPSSGLGRRPQILAADLPTGWYLVQRKGYECRDNAVWTRLSSGCEVVSLFVEEHVMVSHVCGWKDGRRLWSVGYDSEKDAQHLEANGDVPSEYAEIAGRVRGDPDAGIGTFFGVPCELAATLTGYCYDAPMKEQVVASFDVLTRPSLLKRLFG
jgi:hypothetical protein